MHQITLSDGSGDCRRRECAAGVNLDRDAGAERRDDMGALGPRSAQDIFYGYSDRSGWDFPTQADVLLNWFGEAMIDPLLSYIQEADQTDEFEEFLSDNFGDGEREDDKAERLGGHELRL